MNQQQQRGVSSPTRSKKGRGGLVLPLLLLLGLAMCALSVTTAAALEAPERTISLTGSASASLSPDLAVAQFAVDIEAKEASAALKENSILMNKVIDGITSLGLTEAEISTSQFSINPVYDPVRYDSNMNIISTKELRGYRVSNTIRVETTKLSLLSPIVDTAVKYGVNTVHSVSYSLSPAKRKTLSDELLAAAMKNAKERAEKVLAPVSYTIKGVHSVSVDSSSTVGSSYVFAKAMSVERSSSPLYSSDEDVSQTIQVTFIIAPKECWQPSQVVSDGHFSAFCCSQPVYGFATVYALLAQIPLCGPSSGFRKQAVDSWLLLLPETGRCNAGIMIFSPK